MVVLRKPTHLLTDTVREICRTRSRFLSIFVLAVLAVAFLAGLRSTAPNMQRSADAYYDGQGLMDLRVVATLGLTREDVAALAAQPGIAAAEGSWTVDAIASASGREHIVKVHSLSDRGFNAPVLTQGRLPEQPWECLCEPGFLAAAGLTLGDTVSLYTGTGDYEGALAYSTFTLVGTAHTPLYVNIERGNSSLGAGKASAYLLLPARGFTMETYTEIYLSAQGVEGLFCYDDPYQDRIDALIDSLEPVGDRRATLRRAQVMAEANAALADAQQELDRAEGEMSTQLADAQQELREGRAELDDGWRDYHDGLATFRREVAQAETDLAEGYGELTDGEAEYADGLQDLAEGWDSYRDGLEELEEGLAEYNDGLTQLLEGESDYNIGLAELQDAQAEFDEGYADYQSGLADLVTGAQELEDAKRGLEEGAQELFAGGQQLGAERSGFYAQAARLEALVAPVLALSAGYIPTDVDGFIDRMNDPLAQPGDWAALDATRSALAAAHAADPTALPPQSLQLLYGLGAAFDPWAYETYTATAAGLAYGRAALADAQSKLDWGRLAYESGRADYEDGRRALHDGARELEEHWLELEDGRRQLAAGRAQLTDGRRDLDRAWAELSDGRRTWLEGKADLEEAYRELTDGEAELADARAELDDGWAEYRDGVATLARETADGQEELRDAYGELADGEAEYADGLADYQAGREEAEVELADARQELAQARRDLAELEESEWYILGRNTNAGYASFGMDAERMGNLSTVFPLIFFLVAALVCLTTMTRMVEEQRVQIGSLKALGYRRRDISVKYIGYGALSSLAGGLVGLAVGCTLIPMFIFDAWRALYTLGDLELQVYPGISLSAVLSVTLTVTGAALAACLSTLQSQPASLMRPKAPPLGKRVLLERVPALWSRLSFSHKVTIRNLFRYKKRFWMTIIGIGGCTALIITGFGLRDSLRDVMHVQYGELYHYTAQVSLADHLTAEEQEEIASALTEDRRITNWAQASQTPLSVESGSRAQDATLLTVLEPQVFPQFITLRHRTDGAPVSLSDQGVVLSEKLALVLGVGPGDTVTLAGDRRVTVPVADVTEHYVMHYVYLTPDCYAALYGAPPQPNLVLAAYQSDDAALCADIATRLLHHPGVVAVSRISDARATFSVNLAAVDYAVVLITGAAAALAFVVLFNLSTINITERRRELATLKVLGFYDGEVSSYVFRENLFLTAFGIAAGLVMGFFLHRWLVTTVEIDLLMFVRRARPASYGYAAGLTALFALLVNAIGHFRLKNIDMVDSLKTVE